MHLTKHFHIQHWISTMVPCKHLILTHPEVGVGRATTNHPALDPKINESLDPLCRLLTPKRKNFIPAFLILRTVAL